MRLWTQLSASPHTVHFRWMSFIDHAAPSASKVVGEGEALDSKEPEMGKRGSGVTDGEVYKG